MTQATPTKLPIVHLGKIVRQHSCFWAVLGKDGHLFFYACTFGVCAGWMKREVKAHKLRLDWGY
jgi:hypothetical protein